jgi:RNA polymerase sigma factor (sigma-70 family)
MDLTRVGDEHLADAVATGRQRAFAHIYERYQQPLYRYCRSMLHSDADAQDALQSTFAAALSALQRRQRSAPLRPWLFRIAHNESVTLIRRRREEPTEHPHAHLMSAGADEVAHGRERFALLVNDLGELPPRQRSALVMRELSGLSHAEIAHALSTTESAAKAAIFDARTALAEFAEGRDLPCEEVKRTLSDRDRRALKGRRLRSHLRSCASCAAFAAAIDQRQADLRALTPALAPAVSAAMFARLVGNAGGGGAGSSAAAGVVGKLGSTTLVSKATIGAAVIVSAAGVDGVIKVLPHSHGHPSAVAPAAAHGQPSSLLGQGSSANGAPTTSRAVTSSSKPRAKSARSATTTTASHGRGAVSSSGAHRHRASASSTGSSQAAHTQSGSSGSSAAHPTHPVHPVHPLTPSNASGTTTVHPVHPVTGAGNAEAPAGGNGNSGSPESGGGNSGSPNGNSGSARGQNQKTKG